MKVLIASSILLATTAHAAVTSLECPVESIRMYADHTQLTRACSVDLPVGESQFLVTHLPSDLAMWAFSVSISGEQTRVVSAHPHDWDTSTDPQIAECLEEIEFLKERIERDSLQLELNRQHLEYFNTVAEGIALTPGFSAETAIAEVNHFAKSSTESRLEPLRAISKLESKIAGYTKAIEHNQDLIAQREESLTEFSRAALITLSSEAAVTADLKVSYWSSSASWDSTASLVLSSGSSSIDATFEAAITQSTGLDWPEGAQLSVSNITGRELFNHAGPTNSYVPWALTVTLPEDIPSGLETPVHVPVLYTTAATYLALEAHPVIPKYSQLTITFQAPLPEQFGGANARIICDGNLSGEVRLPGSDRTDSFDIQIEAPEGFSL